MKPSFLENYWLVVYRNLIGCLKEKKKKTNFKLFLKLNRELT